MTSGPQFREGERRLAAVAFTDIVGYSGVVHRDERLGQKMVDRQNAVVQAVLPRFGGRVIKGTGDGFLLVFGSALSAVKAISLIQAQLATGDEPVNLRASVHLGDVDYVRGDLYGDGVNTAARLMTLSPDGGLAISAMVRMQVRQQLDLEFRSIGTPPLKNIEAPLEVFVADPPALQALAAKLADEAPAVTEDDEASSAPPPRRTWIKPAAILAGVLVVAAALLLSGRLVGNKRALDDVSDKSIAVLPFVNLSSDKEQEFFSDGISEDLLNLLTKVQTLQVAARTSSFSFKGKDTGIQDIAVALHVAHLLQGSVRKSGNQVRITAQLVRAGDGYQMWSQSWDRELDDVFRIQDEIAQAVVAELKVQLLGEAPTAKPVDPKVYPLILQADALLSQFNPDSMKRAVAIYEQALAIAPNEPRALAALGRALMNQVLSARLPVAEAVPRVTEASNKALALDPTNVIALMNLGAVAADVNHDLPVAASYLERARQLEPTNPVALRKIGTLLMQMGRANEGIAVSEFQAIRDPANAGIQNNLALVRYTARQWDASIEAYRSALRLSPQSFNAHFSIGVNLLLGKHDADAALAEFRLETDESNLMAGEVLALHALGRHQEADARLRAMIEKYGEEQPEFVATIQAYRGNRDAAFEWLEKAIAIHDPFLGYVLTDPLFDSLHEDPRWLPYLRKIGYAPEQLAKIQLNATLPESGTKE